MGGVGDFVGDLISGPDSPPAPPDYRGAAEAQAQSSRGVTEQQTWANRPTQITPWGRTDWQNVPVWDPTTGQYLNRWAQTTQLNPLAQSSLDSQMLQQLKRSQLGNFMTDRLYQDFAQRPDFSGLPDFQRAAQVPGYSPEAIQRSLDFSSLGDLQGSDRYRGRAEDAIFEKGASRLDRRIGEGRDALINRLANQGLSQGDEAYDRALRDFEEGATDAYGQLQMDAIIGGGTEAARDFGMDLSRRGQLAQELYQQGGFFNQAAQQALNQQLGLGGQSFDQMMRSAGFNNDLRNAMMADTMTQRGFTLNEINAIMSGQQVGMPQMPSFQAANRSAPVNYMGAAQNQWGADRDVFSAEQAGKQQYQEGLMNLGGMAAKGMMASDRRLKENVEKHHTLPNGLNVYSWNYVWDDARRFVGFMADEVRELFPQAVVTNALGYDMVDYGAIQ